MATIVIKTETEVKAKEILKWVYEADRQGGYTNNMRSFSGSVLTANIIEGNNVEIHSNYYQELTLKLMFDIS